MSIAIKVSSWSDEVKYYGPPRAVIVSGHASEHFPQKRHTSTCMTCEQNSDTTAYISLLAENTHRNVWPRSTDYIAYKPPPMGLRSQCVSEVFVALMARNKVTS